MIRLIETGFVRTDGAVVNVIDVVRASFDFDQLSRRIDGGALQQAFTLFGGQLGQLQRIVAVRTNEVLDECSLQLGEGDSSEWVADGLLLMKLVQPSSVSAKDAARQVPAAHRDSQAEDFGAHAEP